MVPAQTTLQISLSEHMEMSIYKVIIMCVIIQTCLVWPIYKYKMVTTLKDKGLRFIYTYIFTQVLVFVPLYDMIKNLCKA